MRSHTDAGQEELVKLTSNVFCQVEVSNLCRPVNVFHTKLGHIHVFVDLALCFSHEEMQAGAILLTSAKPRFVHWIARQTEIPPEHKYLLLLSPVEVLFTPFYLVLCKPCC
ncbi:hypothetical protein XENORESO_000580 [Xenotaenia resolanae]|uniref:Uncharacterized protein n=1 Tax=Xenotaenia resolanae TaxID=208358 RepID=A0ABV0VQH6_9TELE